MFVHSRFGTSYQKSNIFKIDISLAQFVKIFPGNIFPGKSILPGEYQIFIEVLEWLAEPALTESPTGPTVNDWKANGLSQPHIFDHA